jgi:hypothetical protein
LFEEHGEGCRCETCCLVRQPRWFDQGFPHAAGDHLTVRGRGAGCLGRSG